MAEPTCPRCGAMIDLPEVDRLGRCGWCGSLLAGTDDAARARLARPRIAAAAARSAVARALARTGRRWIPGDPQLVFYPFAPSGSPRRPFLPLAQLPPLLAAVWHPSSADLVAAATSPAGRVEGAVRVPVSLPIPAEAPVVHCPIFRVPISQAGSDSAAWCDGSSGVVILPPEFLAGAAGEAATSPAPERRRLADLALAAGAASGLLLPFPASLVPAALAALLLARRLRRS